MSNKQNPATKAAAITPSDAAEVTIPCMALYIGGAGNVAVITSDGDTVTFVGATAGSIIPVQCSKILATGTTATSIVALGN